MNDHLWDFILQFLDNSSTSNIVQGEILTTQRDGRLLQWKSETEHV